MRKPRNVMLAYPFDEGRLAKWNKPYFVQPKLDGIRCIAKNLLDEPVTLLSSTGEQIVSVPHLLPEIRQNLPFGIWDGELYVHGWKFEQIVSVVNKRKTLDSKFEEVELHLFDQVDFNEPQHKRLLRLNILEKEIYSSKIKIVPTYTILDMEQLLCYAEKFLRENYEGLVVRNYEALYENKRSTGLMKLKFGSSDAYLITGTVEEIDKFGNGKQSLGALVCYDGKNYFNVGTGFSREDRVRLWEERESLPGRYALVKYQELTKDRQVPRFPVYVSIIDPETAKQVERLS